MHVLLHYRADVVLTLLTRRDLDNIRVRDSTVNVVQPSIDHITIYLVASREAPLSSESGGTSHVMQLVGTAAGIPAHILFDSGAEKYNYTSADFCSRNHIAVQPNKLTVTVKGVQNNEGTVHGQCTWPSVVMTITVQ